jgi:hypothetical protein
VFDHIIMFLSSDLAGEESTSALVKNNQTCINSDHSLIVRPVTNSRAEPTNVDVCLSERKESLARLIN